MGGATILVHRGIVECDTRIPPSSRPIAVVDDQAGDDISYSVSPSGNPGANRRQCGDSVSAGDRFLGPDSYWDGWRWAVSERKLTNPEDVQEAISDLKVSKAPDQNGLPNMALKHLPKRAISLLVLIFNAILLTHHARSSDLCTETGEGSSTAIILSAH